jgi:hypothetical protein
MLKAIKPTQTNRRAIMETIERIEHIATELTRAIIVAKPEYADVVKAIVLREKILEELLARKNRPKFRLI